MRSFACVQCGQLLFFENSHCLRCGAELGFVPQHIALCTIEATGSRGYRLQGERVQHEKRVYKRCGRAQLAACNWLVAEGDDELCESCRLTGSAPKLRNDAQLKAFAKAEGAKRRLIYQLLDLGLPIVTRAQDPARGLGFVLALRSASEPVLTGHLDGLITVDLSECDNAHRERLRECFGEPYRTLLGHFRHEIGHYYWNVLIDDTGSHAQFRQYFGDERMDYAAALQRNYHGPVQGDWSQRHVSAYAASHPWEDWAETFAHYLHIRDTLQTAAHFGLHVSPRAATIPPAGGKLSARATDITAQRDFAAVIAEWLPLTYAFNAANRSMGKEDLYPFVLAPQVIEKLAFVHDLVRDVREPARRGKSTGVGRSAGITKSSGHNESESTSRNESVRTDPSRGERHEQSRSDGDMRLPPAPSLPSLNTGDTASAA
ncbi:MAG: hypothetical protein RL701_5155 [Pseudomonadota bacterium]